MTSRRWAASPLYIMNHVYIHRNYYGHGDFIMVISSRRKTYFSHHNTYYNGFGFHANLVNIYYTTENTNLYWVSHITDVYLTLTLILMASPFETHSRPLTGTANCVSHSAHYLLLKSSVLCSVKSGN